MQLPGSPHDRRRAEHGKEGRVKHRFLKRVVVAEQAKLTSKRPKHHERDALSRAGDTQDDLNAGERLRGMDDLPRTHRRAQGEKWRNPDTYGGVMLLLLRLRVRARKCSSCCNRICGGSCVDRLSVARRRTDRGGQG